MSYVDANGVHTYYEEHGSGDPLLLLHGGLADASGFALQTPAFAERYRVLVPDRRGHGRTPDVDANASNVGPTKRHCHSFSQSDELCAHIDCCARCDRDAYGTSDCRARARRRGWHRIRNVLAGSIPSAARTRRHASL